MSGTSAGACAFRDEERVVPTDDERGDAGRHQVTVDSAVVQL